MYRAYLDSTSFDFEAYGETANEARDTLIAGLCEHGRVYGVDREYLDLMIASTQVYEIRSGEAYRDREPMRACEGCTLVPGLFCEGCGIPYAADLAACPECGRETD